MLVDELIFLTYFFLFLQLFDEDSSETLTHIFDRQNDPDDVEFRRTIEFCENVQF